MQFVCDTKNFPFDNKLILNIRIHVLTLETLKLFMKTYLLKLVNYTFHFILINGFWLIKKLFNTLLNDVIVLHYVSSISMMSRYIMCHAYLILALLACNTSKPTKYFLPSNEIVKMNIYFERSQIQFWFQNLKSGS